MKLRFTVEIEREGGWISIGELTQLPGVLGRGRDSQEAEAALKRIALRILLDELRETEQRPGGTDQGSAPSLFRRERPDTRGTCLPR